MQFFRVSEKPVVLSGVIADMGIARRHSSRSMIARYLIWHTSTSMVLHADIAEASKRSLCLTCYAVYQFPPIEQLQSDENAREIVLTSSIWIVAVSLCM
jgi:hypothetical protein